MKNYLPHKLLLLTLLLPTTVWSVTSSAEQPELLPNAENEQIALPAHINLEVPFTSEIPDGKWIAPWNNACEEASITMIEQYYLGKKIITKKEAKNLMTPLFAWEDKQFGSNKDSNSERTLRIINEYSSFTATAKLYPTLNDIKQELHRNHPVISLHYGFDLNNPLLHFRATGSSYHMMVIVGYDDEKQEFLVNDSGHQGGLDSRYSYDTILNTLHDFDHERLKADGPPTVLFTSPRSLVKTEKSPAVYLVEQGTKYPILHSGILKQHRWSWALLKIISEEELAEYPTGDLIEA